jgi:hypothetical protein
MLIINDRHLYRVIDEYVTYYNHARPHQGIGQRIPDPEEDDKSGVGDKGQRVACKGIQPGFQIRMLGLQGLFDMPGKLFTLRWIAVTAADDRYLHGFSG